MKLVDRVASNLNKRKLLVENVVTDAAGKIKELIVTMERADTPSQIGTALTANVLTEAIKECIASNVNLANAIANTQSVFDSSDAVATTAFVWNVLLALHHDKLVEPATSTSNNGSGGS